MLTWEKIIPTLISLAAFGLALFKTRGESREKREKKEKEQAESKDKWVERFIKLETEFLAVKTYILKGVVVEFHSNPNPKTDKIIEKVLHDEPLKPNEKEQLLKKIETCAEEATETKQKLAAQAKLELLSKLFEIEDMERSIHESSCDGYMDFD